ncbi:MAG: hypothetical protein QM564_10230 [Bergeyella sp.]
MKNYIPNWLIFCVVLICVISAFFAFMSFHEYYNVGILKEYSEYPFGAEGPVAGVWHYKNADNYVLYNLIFGCVSAIILLLNLISFFEKNQKLMKLGIAVFVLAFIIDLLFNM